MTTDYIPAIMSFKKQQQERVLLRYLLSASFMIVLSNGTTCQVTSKVPHLSDGTCLIFPRAQPQL